MRVGGQRHAPTALPPGKRPGTHCETAPEPHWTAAENIAPFRDSISGPSSQRVAVLTELSRPTQVSTVCPTRYRTRHFFNNFTTIEDIAMKFGIQTHSSSFLT